MSFKDLTLKKEYRSLIDNIVKDFYCPVLGQSVLYKRAVGFFSSTALADISKGLSKLVDNGGKIELVASPHISNEDWEAIKDGYKSRDEVIRKSVLGELYEPKNKFEEKRLNMLAHLIATGKLDIKIAFIEKNNVGIFHEKMGLMYDEEGNAIAFTGSMNESDMAFSHNYESIDVFCSWTYDSDRVETKAAAFDSVWNNTEPGVEIVDCPEVKDEIIKKYIRTEKLDYQNVDEEEIAEIDEFNYNEELRKNERSGAVVPGWVKFHDYQDEAIDEWERKGFRGIFDMATGTGKTFTGLGAISRISEALEDKLAVVIVAPYQHLVEQWVEDIVKFNMDPIIGFSSSSQKDWKRRLEDAVRDQKLKVRKREFFCFVCTNATFSSDFVQRQIGKIRGNALLVVDEAHNFGAEHLSKFLTGTFNYRLALSATLDRHGDPEGTQKLLDYFGERCITYTLDRAIDEKKLTPYKYYPIIVTLTEDELRRYGELSFEIAKCMMVGKDGKRTLSERGKTLAQKRARLVAGAENKLTTLKEEIQPYIEDKHILVYCGATRILKPSEEYTAVDDDEIRQIDAVTHILGNELNMKVSQFTSNEDIHEREVLKEQFSDGENLQALIAIKCLDEGVNIPEIKTAFILASTTNPKEYIQRRGRVLRKAPGKEYAEIYDFITLPRELDEVSAMPVEQMNRELTLVKNEIFRAEEFARIALNAMEADSVICEIKEAYSIDDSKFVLEEEEFDYGN